MNYRDYNDFELLSYIAENNEDANEIIFKKYEPLINSIANKMYRYCKNSGLEINDLIQEGRLGLNEAINSYSSNKNTAFYTYARTCIERNIITMVVQTKRLKNKFLNESISLEFTEDEKYKLDSIVSDNKLNPEKQILDYESEKEIIDNIKSVLTDFEQQVFDLKLSSFSYKEIAELLDKDSKSIDNAIQRIRIKAKEQLKV